MFISFMEAVRIGIIQRFDPINPVALFSDYEIAVTLTSDKTGYKENQTFLREDDIEWYLDKDDLFKVPTLYGSATKFKLYLSGIIGLSNISEILRRMATVFENMELGCIARTMPYEHVKQSERLLAKLGKEWSWTDNIYVSTYSIDNKRDYGVNLIGEYSADYFAFLYNSNGYNYCTCNSVHPVISIVKSDVRVDLESYARDGVWKLLPP